MIDNHSILQLSDNSNYIGRICPSRRTELGAGDTVVICERTSEIISVEGWTQLEKCLFCGQMIHKPLSDVSPLDDSPVKKAKYQGTRKTSLDPKVILVAIALVIGFVIVGAILLSNRNSSAIVNGNENRQGDDSEQNNISGSDSEEIVVVEVTHVIEVTRMTDSPESPTLSLLSTPRATSIPQPTNTSRPAKTAAPQPSPSVPSLVNVTFTRPTEQNWNNTTSIWSLTNFEDMRTSGTQIYNVTVRPADVYRWSFAWCATDQSRLSDILAPLTVSMFFKENLVSSPHILQHEVATSDGWQCRYWSTIISDWPSGEIVELEVAYILTEGIYDGKANYDRGNYHQVIIVSVK